MTAALGPAPIVIKAPVASPMTETIVPVASDLVSPGSDGPARIKWRGLVAPVSVPTGDGRMFAPGKMTHRPLPIPFMARFSSGGHSGAVPIGRVKRIFDGPGGYWAEGDFLDPEHVPEVPKSIYMIQQGVMGPSLDLDQNFTVEMIDHPSRNKKKAALFKEYNAIGITLVPMPAFHQVHLSVDSEPTRALLASLGVNVDAMPLFDVNGDAWRSWPIAPREYRFDADDAVKRIAHWAGVGSREPDLDRYASAFLWRDGNQMGNTLAQDSFRLPLADIINGQPYLIYHAVYSAAALLSGGHGGLPNVPDQDKAAMVPVINELYGVFADAFGDPNLKSPFLERVQQASIVSEEEDCGCDTAFATPAVEEEMQEEQAVETTTALNVVQMPQTEVTTFGYGRGVTLMLDNQTTAANNVFIKICPVEEEKALPYSDGIHEFVDGVCINCGY